MKITVKSFLTLRRAMGNQAEFEMDVDSITLRDLLDLLCGKFGESLKQQIFDPKTNEISQLLRVLINGRHYTTLPDKMETQLQDNDEIALFPPVAGG
jgi:molybdopterin synthase sulfur carrier subunit